MKHLQGFGSIRGMLILGGSSLTSGSFGSTFGGGGIFIFIGGGGGVVGKINCVCSYRCCWMACLAV